MSVSARSSRVLLLLTLLGVVAAAGIAAGAPTPECGRSCRSSKRSCIRQAKALRPSSAFHEKIRECRAGLGRCRTCCRQGGSATSCVAPTNCGTGQAFESTWAGLQELVFERHGCTQQLCHGAAAQGSLRLTPDVAYQSIFGAPSTGSSLKRVEPGDQRRSYLWLKLAAKTDPSSLPPDVQIASPMPNVGPALTTEELEALRLWIYAGAPEIGTVTGTDTLLGACLPPPEPLQMEPLPPPATGTGFQLAMPPWRLERHSEHETCFATYFDISAQVPKEFQDPSGTLFRFNAQELRQDPQSHHLILNLSTAPVTAIHDPSFGKWTCRGGRREGKVCEPTDLTSCGKRGVCTSEIKQSFACIGFGPRGANRFSIGGAQKAQSFSQFYDGVFAQVPMKGILYWNSHAFNLTDRDTVMHGWLNYYLAPKQQYPIRGIFNVARIFSANAAPFTEQTLCNDQQLPKGARLFNLSSHTHKRGKRFWVEAPDGSMIYENFVYNDPATREFDPPLAFDSDDPAQRRLQYCATYNNGVKPDGSPDVEFVSRRSRTPDSALTPCTPVACAAGRVGAPCGGAGASHDRECDSTPGANDGFCDACNITGGESTENEMFILIGQFYVPPAGSVATAARAMTAETAGGVTSASTEIAPPPVHGCTSVHAAHAGHDG